MADIYSNGVRVGLNGKTPYIGDNGNWWVGNTDTGRKAQGASGKTPEKGMDYFTEEDISEIVDEVVEKVPPYDDSEIRWEVSGVKEELSTKIASPENPIAGKILKVLSVNDDGTFVCEWGDAPAAGVTDVQVNGNSIVSQNVANISLSALWKKPDITNVPVLTGAQNYGWTYGIPVFFAGYTRGITTVSYEGIPIMALKSAGKIGTQQPLTNRGQQGSAMYGVIDSTNFDDAARAAMTDGKGAAWTPEEQEAARERQGIRTMTQEAFDLLPLDERGGIIIIEPEEETT